MTGLLIEAMSAEGYRKVTPAYFETTLKTKLTSDPDGVEMLDIIMRDRIMDLSYVHANKTKMNNAVNGVLTSADPNFASYYAANESVALDYVEKLNEFYANN
ncbi:MAG: hypothetical protein J6I45_07715 [Clostridia bacterium]|nr:hypothetical protein [Clostridia bacterium]